MAHFYLDALECDCFVFVNWVGDNNKSTMMLFAYKYTRVQPNFSTVADMISFTFDASKEIIDYWCHTEYILMQL